LLDIPLFGERSKQTAMTMANNCHRFITMRGNLSEIDLRTALQLIEMGQRTGELYLATPTGRAWLVFFHAGQITWAMNLKDVGYQRLQDCLEFLQLSLPLNQLIEEDAAHLTVPEYACLCALVQRQWLTPSQAHAILHHLIRETLFDLLNLTQAQFNFVAAPALAPPLTSLRPTTLFTEVGSRLLKWQQLYPHVSHPDQVLAITQPSILQMQIPPDLFERLTIWANQGVSLRRLGRLLGKEVFIMAKALLPYLQQGIITLRDLEGSAPIPQTQSSQVMAEDFAAMANKTTPSSGTIFCIDDNLTVCQAVAGTLREQGYGVTTNTDPLQALSLVFALKPDLILCDIVMPGLDGYQFCTMLRQTCQFRHTPIVMLTGQAAFVDRALSRQAGATDYLSKPFESAELLTLVRQMLSLPVPSSRPEFDLSVADPVVVPNEKGL
jgi:twitching motility two-component system response regulator PilG